MPIVLDDSAWPILHHSLGDHSCEDFERFGAWYLRAVKRALAEGVLVYVVSDVRGGVPGQAIRRHAVAWLAGLDRQQFEACMLSIIVIDDPLLRGVITAVNWFRRPTRPQEVVDTYEAAWMLIVEDHSRRRLSVPQRPAWLISR